MARTKVITTEAVAERLTQLRARCAVAGDGDVTIIGVTKGHGADAIRAATGAGLDAVGESYAQELLAKHDELDLETSGRWPDVHFIGGLQRNKVRRLAGLVDVWQSVDRADLVDEIAKRSPGGTIMVQVRLTSETTKVGGCPPAAVAAVVERAEQAGLVVLGLMGIGPFGDPEDARPGFRLLRSMVDDLGLSECSMGMSGDLEVAISEGSSMIRVGTDLFGPRPAPR
jgi:pyridoxal phosphate enzyme (YggS family)